MKQLTKIASNNFIPTGKNNLKSVSETSNFSSQVKYSDKKIKPNCDSVIAEETVNTIIDYFNKHSSINNNFNRTIFKKISEIEFAYPNDNLKLKAIINENSTSSFNLLSEGMKNMLDAFNKYNSILPKSYDTYIEDIDFIVETPIENHNSYLLWVDQTINEPWFKL